MKRIIDLEVGDRNRARDGTRVNSGCPGHVGTPEDVASGMLFPVSADPAYVFGTALTIDCAVTAK